MTPAKDPRAEPDDEPVAPKQATDASSSIDDERPIDIAAAVRAARTAASHGRTPTPQETAKMGAFELEQALAKLHATKDEPARPRMPSMPTPMVELKPADLPKGVAKEEKAEEDEKAEADPKPVAIAEKAEEPKPIAKPIPIPEPSDPGPMVASVPDPRIVRETPRGIPRSTILLIVIGFLLVFGLWMWSRSLR